MDLANNKKAYHEYTISDTYEAGLVLSGPEVKSAKKGSVDLKGAYITVDGNSQAWLTNAFIAAYKPAKAAQTKYDPHQSRRLLLTKKQIRSLIGKQKEKGVSIIPLKIYVKSRLVKVEIGIGKGKKKHDKRESIKKKDFERRKRNALKR